MADLSTLQQQDNYSSRLASKYTAGGASMIVNTAPSFTYSVDFYVTVEPGTTNARSYKISGISGSTLTVSGSAPVAGYEGDTPTSIDHPAGSTVIISNNFKFYDDIRDAINAKVDTSGDTMTGLLQFSGTTHAGIRLISLTTAQRTALTAANGDLVYDTDDNLVYQYKGGAWASVDTGTTTPNGSTTVAGIFELATVAEQGTATGTGGSGASLVPANANLVKTSSGAGDENKIAILNASGQFDSGFVDLSGVDDTTKIPLSTVTTKGDSIWATAASTVSRVAIGSTATMGLRPNTGASPGVEWRELYFSGRATGSDTTTGSTTVDSTFSPGFTAKMIRVHYQIQGADSGTNYYAGGINEYNGTSLVFSHQFFNNVISGTITNSSITIGTSAPTAGVGTPDVGDVLITFAVQSVSSTQVVIRTTLTRPGGGAQSASYTYAVSIFG